MEFHDLDSSVLIAVAVLVSLARLTRVLFGTLRLCVREYYEFRMWLRDIRRTYVKDG